MYKKINTEKNNNGDYMNEEKYKSIVDKYIPYIDKKTNYKRAFIMGGIIGLIGQLLIELFTNRFSYEISCSLMMITLIFISCLFTSLGFMDNLVKKYQSGLFLPITGFAHATCSASLDFKNEGFIKGIGSNFFKLSGSVIVYGTVFSYVFSLIRYILFGD